MTRFTRQISRALLALASIAAVSVTAFAQTNDERVMQSLAAGRAHRADEVLIQYKPQSDAQLRSRTRGRVAAAGQRLLRAATERNDGKGDLELVRLPAGSHVATALKALQQDPDVEFAEPNWIYRHTATSNDPGYTSGQLWGMYGDASSPQNAFGSQAAEAWTRGTIGSSTVYVGIIDEGVMVNHEDLSANIWRNPYDPVDGSDNDGNGYVDDANGWDFVSNNRSVYDGTADDHGTHVAGTIGAVGGNGRGVAGVNWRVKMIACKFLGSSGGSSSNAIRAIDYLIGLKRRHGLNIVAINNSWGGGGYSQALRDAIERANAANILFICAAGNGGSDGVGDNNDVSPHYPSSYNNANVISVASITRSGGKSGFSNYGRTSVDLGAPGSSIYSTLPSSTGLGTYGTYSGTSMATPHVCGAAALYASRNPGRTAAQIKSALFSSVIPTPALNGITVTGGRLNVGGF